jgi:tetratricopeptide (TPR) repeat protein
MLSKIEVYREVLDIEPNSKVFFPLARQLAAEGHHDEAAAVLTRGIGYHPDHLEAKFLLIELLTRQGSEEQADAVFADVGSMLARYPSVWLLWSKHAAARSKDPSLAMLFLAHYFQNQTLTWADVMERGLKSLSQTGTLARPEVGAGPKDQTPDLPVADAVPDARPAAAGPVADAVPETTVAAPAPPAPDLPPCAAAPRPESRPASPAGRGDSREPGGGPELRGAREVLALANILDAPEEPVERSRSRSAKTREPAVRTKTMAALLAGQGDTAGALEIYGDLLAATPKGPERAELAGLMAALSPEAAQQSPEETAAPADAVPLSQDGVTGPKGSARLASFLEALAGRLEARAGS